MVVALFTFLIAQASSDQSSACSVVSSNVMQFHRDLVTLSELDHGAGSAAIDVANRRGLTNKFKIVEDNIELAKNLYNQDITSLTDVLAKAEDMPSGNPRDESVALLGIYKERFEGLRTFGSLALNTERLVNSRNLDFRRAAIIQSFQQPKQTTIVTNTYGSGSASISSSQGPSYVYGNGSTTSRSTITAPNTEVNPTAAALATRGQSDQEIIAADRSTLESTIQSVAEVPLSVQTAEDQWGTACKIEVPHEAASPSTQKWED